MVPEVPRHAIGVEPARVRKLLPATVTGTMGQQLNRCEWLETLLSWNYNPASVMYIRVNYIQLSHVLTSNNIVMIYIDIVIVIFQESHWSSLIIISYSYPACSGPFHCMPLTACMPSAQICHSYRLPAHRLWATRAISQQKSTSQSITESRTTVCWFTAAGRYIRWGVSNILAQLPYQVAVDWALQDHCQIQWILSTIGWNPVFDCLTTGAKYISSFRPGHA